MSLADLLWAIPMLPLSAGLLCALLGSGSPGPSETDPVRGSWASRIANLGVLASLLLSILAILALEPSQGALRFEGPEWIRLGDLQIDLDLSLDPLSAWLLGILMTVASLVLLASRGPSSEEAADTGQTARLSLLVGAMATLLLAEDLLVLLLGWQGLTLVGSLLLGPGSKGSRCFEARAAQKAWISQSLGDLALLFAIGLLFSQTGNLDLGQLREDQGPVSRWLDSESAQWASLCMVLAVMSKAAQMPFLGWGTDAATSGTSSSALLQSVTSGMAAVYLVCRSGYLWPIEGLQVLAWAGGLSALLCAGMALFQRELKKSLACASSSQCGLMLLACGCGAFPVAVLHLGLHGLAKAQLVLCAGWAIQERDGVEDLHRMGGLRSRSRPVFVAFSIATLSLAGLPPLAGSFVHADLLWGTVQGNSTQAWILWTLGATTLLLTALGSMRLSGLVFLAPADEVSGKAAGAEEGTPRSLLLPIGLLSLLCLGTALLAVPAWLLGEGAWLGSWLRGSLAEVLPMLGSDRPQLDPFLETGFGLGTWLLSLGGILLGWRFYRQGPGRERILCRRLGPLHGLLHGRGFVDGFVELFVLAPVTLLTRVLSSADRRLDRGLEPGIAEGRDGFRSGMARLQEERLPLAALWAAGGLLLLIVWVALELLG